MSLIHLEETLKGIYRENEPLSQYTAWRVGGKAQRYFRPADLSDLRLFLSHLNEAEPLFWMGLGSNLLIRDGGIPGTVIHTYKMSPNITLENDAGLIRVEAGASCAKVAKFCIKHGLSGGAFFAGIPGTIGGALAMNAGAFGLETWSCVAQVETLDRRGASKLRNPSDYKIQYRSVQGPANEWFGAAFLQFDLCEPQETQTQVKTLLKKRSESQPIGQLSCGSVFKNPPGDFAARLIETAKLKGKMIGQAQVSLKHANFIINLGGASASDIERLLLWVQAEVLKVHGILLQPEVKIVGKKED